MKANQQKPFAVEYQPLRGLTRLLMKNDPLTFVYTNVSRSKATLIDDGSDMHRSQIKHVWNLLTMDMHRSGMPIVITHQGRMYDIYYSAAGYIIRCLDGDRHFMDIFPRPLTPYHVFYMLDNNCDMVRAVYDLKMTQSTLQSWVARRGWLL